MTIKFSEDETRNKEMTAAYQQISQLIAQAVRIAERFEITDWSSALTWVGIALRADSGHLIRDAMKTKVVELGNEKADRQ